MSQHPRGAWGETKPGQKYQNVEAFKAHRNLKRAVRDVSNDEHIKNKACIGVCRRCTQKVLWRFKYEKYKAMKGRNGNCTGCRLPKVRFAYRAICDDCAKKTKRCPG